MKKIGVLGAGTWGMALARMLCVSGHNVSVCSALANEVEEFSATRRHPNLPGMEIPAEIAALLDERAAARAAKNWAESDRLRDEIAAKGWLVKDSKEGQSCTKK
jgi:glycerol-3-phosphate dehydrogenase